MKRKPNAVDDLSGKISKGKGRPLPEDEIGTPGPSKKGNPPNIRTEKELVGEIESIQAAIAKAVQDRVDVGHRYGGEVVSALLGSVEHILSASKIDPQSTVRMAVLIARKESWAMCLDQYHIDPKEERDAEATS